MKHSLQLVAAAILIILSLSASAKAPVVWDTPISAYTPNRNILYIDTVELSPDNTLLRMRIKFPKGESIRIARNTYLETDGQQYPITGAAVIDIDKWFRMPESGEINVQLSFAPLPCSTENFNFIEPGGWKIFGIRDKDSRPSGIVNTYWRDDASGDWIIGIGENVAVYDNRFWEIKQLKEKKGSYAITLSDGSENIDIKMGRDKNGMRKVNVNGGKTARWSVIAGDALPDYPMADGRKGFKDNGYTAGDSVTIIGWFKDMPEDAWKNGRQVEIAYNDIMSDEEQSFHANMDSLGRFKIRFPILNSSQIFLDWVRIPVTIPVEPDETYLFLYDFSTGHKLFMGNDVRLQNELTAHPVEWAEQIETERKGIDAFELLGKFDNMRKHHHKKFSQQLEHHPTLSERYREYAKKSYDIMLATDMMQKRFIMPEWKFPKEYYVYVDSIWKNRLPPYTIIRDFVYLMDNYLDQPKRTNFSYLDIIKNAPLDLRDRFIELERKGVIQLTDQDHENLKKYVANAETLYNHLKDNSINPDSAEWDEALTRHNTSEFNSNVISELYSRFEAPLKELQITDLLRQPLAIADSIGCDRTVRDFYLTSICLNELEHTYVPFQKERLKFIMNELSLPIAKKRVMEANDKCIALMNRNIDNSLSIKPSSDFENMSDGEKIFSKIIEPYRGKIILTDIWGIWCGPCVQALKNSKEEFERLKPYDIIYLYLANNSREDGWKNIIKENDLIGDNIVHYNLPDDQQKAIESYLGVHSYPTYRLIDQEGNIINLNVDPRNLDTIENIIKQIYKK
ncbi:thioredoxin family protein [Duncaniella freteri]|uniref:TlpA family protein disulfide reductase n=2 Tax=Duncaniella TaxID=2518495 RepID=UPI002572FF37|nr:thioredoxin family protein [Duncaniella freteri]